MVSQHDLERRQFLAGIDGARCFSNSEITCFQRCPREWMLRYHKGLIPRTSEPIGNTALGTLVHDALAGLYVPENPVDPRIGVRTAAAATWDVYEQELQDLFGTADMASIRREEYEKQADFAAIMVDGYMDWLEETGADSTLDPISSEQYLSARIGADSEKRPVYLIGKIDALIYDTVQKKLMFMDHKTGADFTSMSAMLPSNRQMLHYLCLLDSVQPGRADSVYFNMIRRVKRSARSKPPYYQRITQHYNEYQRAAYLRQTMGVISNILNLETQLKGNETLVQMFVPNVPTRDCAWRCSFVHQCPMMDDGSNWAQALAERFVPGDAYARYIK